MCVYERAMIWDNEWVHSTECSPGTSEYGCSQGGVCNVGVSDDLLVIAAHS